MIYHELRLFSGPFDWFITPDLSAIADGFSNKFSTFFQPANISINEVQSENNDCYEITDALTGFISIHELHKNSENTQTALEELKATFDRRSSRFFRCIEKGSTLFIRHESVFDVTQFLLFKRDIESLCGDRFVLLFLVDSAEKNPALHNIQNNVYVYSTFPTLNKSDMYWLGNTKDLYPLFSRLRISGTSETKYCDTLAEIIKNNIGQRRLLVWGQNIYYPIIQALAEYHLGIGIYLYDESGNYDACIPESSIVRNIDCINNEYYIIIPNHRINGTQEQKLYSLNYSCTKDFVLFGLERKDD